GVIFLLEMSYANFLLGNFALWPLAPDRLLAPDPQLHEFMPWQLISYGFLHGSLTHLLVNMYALWLFGVALENLWGSRTFAIYYLVCVIGAGITQIVTSSIGGDYYPTIGASGGVFGILLAFGLFFPNRVLILLIPPMPIKAKWLVIIYGTIELWFGVTGTATGVAHFAHLGGMLFGLILIYYWKQHPPVKR
ncbi:MAG: rhomboid family intramembrane serine protease, partial [Pseudomonadota bacterium]|nr:rhomboid family intramembrane serine protease [Pseudomonadota bacterium]